MLVVIMRITSSAVTIIYPGFCSQLEIDLAQNILRFDSKDNTFEFDHFMTIYGLFLQLHKYISLNLGSEGHFEVLNKSKS